MCILSNLLGRPTHVPTSAGGISTSLAGFCAVSSYHKSTNKGDCAANQYLEGMSVIIFAIVVESQQIFLNFSLIPEEMPSIDNIQFMTLAIAISVCSLQSGGHCISFTNNSCIRLISTRLCWSHSDLIPCPSMHNWNIQTEGLSCRLWCLYSKIWQNL